MDSETNVIHKC